MLCAVTFCEPEPITWNYPAFLNSYRLQVHAIRYLQYYACSIVECVICLQIWTDDSIEVISLRCHKSASNYSLNLIATGKYEDVTTF